jgi:hypothetical protein
MQILEIIGLFAGLALAAALSLVVLLRSAEALSWRHDGPDGGHPATEPAGVPAASSVMPRTPTGRAVAAG